MRRGRPGVGGLKRRQQTTEALKQKGEELGQDKMEHIKQQLDVFKSQLEAFAKKHKKQINKNPVFRRQFQQMCRQVGVDPLASNKGFWAQLLGVGDFYYELAVQVIDACLATQVQNGGMISIDELIVKVMKKRGKLSQQISRDDICNAINKTAILGNGFRIIPVGSRQMVLSVPMEMNNDHMAMLEIAEVNGVLTASSITNELHWDKDRIDRVMKVLLEEGMAWVDEQHESGEVAYWFPSLLGSWSEAADNLL